MTVAAPPDRPAPPVAGRVRLYSWLLLALGTFGFAAFWTLAAVSLDRQLAWLAVLGALDIAWMLRLGGWRRGWTRAALGLIATALIVLVANWGIVAGQLSGPFGLDLASSATKLGPNLFWTLFHLANAGPELIWIAIGLVVAAVASR
ncbi:hypothetical protein RDV84_13670 [Lysobacter yananisis]|uniref:Transmembrane protein n=1 Tax=Lysobacter yananisis TaxID=1003114 RepID=A0ABY9P289_9GAMM|nr:hypothetical protein [Lysobacter yananisis]WMT01057.1 hypothetical protein RDV84_13670 [Lysobacter yananisis]